MGVVDAAVDDGDANVAHPNFEAHVARGRFAHGAVRKIISRLDLMVGRDEGNGVIAREILQLRGSHRERPAPDHAKIGVHLAATVQNSLKMLGLWLFFELHDDADHLVLVGRRGCAAGQT